MENSSCLPAPSLSLSGRHLFRRIWYREKPGHLDLTQLALYFVRVYKTAFPDLDVCILKLPRPGSKLAVFPENPSLKPADDLHALFSRLKPNYSLQTTLKTYHRPPRQLARSPGLRLHASEFLGGLPHLSIKPNTLKASQGAHLPGLQSLFDKAGNIYALPCLKTSRESFWVCIWCPPQKFWGLRTLSQAQRLVDLLKNQLNSQLSQTLQNEIQNLRQSELNLATVVHQLKEPLAQAQTLADTLIASGSPSYSNYFSQTRIFLNQLLMYLNTKQLPLKTHSLIYFLDQLNLGFRDSLKARGIEFSIQYPDVDICIQIHQVALYQVFENLITNASDPNLPLSHISITIESTNKLCTLILSDNGPGLDPQISASLGKPYQPSSNSSGLGLYICKKLLELHGGQFLYAHRSPYRGGSFIISLPLHT